MPRRRTESVQLRLTMPKAAIPRVERMAEALAVDVSTLLRMLVSTQLVQWEAMYLHPQKFVDLAGKVGGPAASAMVDHMQADAAELAGSDAPKHDAPKHDAPGFRPGGKPRSLLEPEAASVPGSEWSGYLRGL